MDDHRQALGTGQIGITLPAAVSCTDDKSICTDDGRKLSHSTSAAVHGPPAMSVADARVEEAEGAVLTFAVTLSRAPTTSVTVDYATSDGTAQAGADYTATSGTLTIPAGSTSATIEVPVLDDAHDDDDETLTLTLANASGAILADATATGTIDNNDVMPRALMARFGRLAAGHIVDQVEQRVAAPRAPGFDGELAGRAINRTMGQDFALGFLRELAGRNAYGRTAAGTDFTGSGTSAGAGSAAESGFAPGTGVGAVSRAPGRRRRRVVPVRAVTNSAGAQEQHWASATPTCSPERGSR